MATPRQFAATILFGLMSVGIGSSTVCAQATKAPQRQAEHDRKQQLEQERQAEQQRQRYTEQERRRQSESEKKRHTKADPCNSTMSQCTTRNDGSRWCAFTGESQQRCKDSKR